MLLPGDPGRALALAQVVLGDDRLMFNHHRGLWGYTGTAADGEPLTIQSTGMGGPSAAIVLEELAALGVRRAVRVGTARARRRRRWRSATCWPPPASWPTTGRAARSAPPRISRSTAR